VRANRPKQIPESLVVDFDIYDLPGSDDDAHLAGE
jgi:hypothetical protein